MFKTYAKQIVKNSKDYNRDVIEVIKDILRERGASIPNEVNKDYAFTPSASSYQQDNNYKPENSSMGIGSLAEKLFETFLHPKPV